MVSQKGGKKLKERLTSAKSKGQERAGSCLTRRLQKKEMFLQRLQKKNRLPTTRGARKDPMSERRLWKEETVRGGKKAGIGK